MNTKSYIDLLNWSEILKTWQASGASAAVLATITFVVLSAAGYADWVDTVTLAVAGLAGALTKLAAELRRLNEGQPIKPSIPDARASDTADFVPGKPA